LAQMIRLKDISLRKKKEKTFKKIFEIIRNFYVLLLGKIESFKFFSRNRLYNSDIF